MDNQDREHSLNYRIKRTFFFKDKDTYSKAFQRMKDIFQQEAFSDIPVIMHNIHMK